MRIIKIMLYALIIQSPAALDMWWQNFAHNGFCHAIFRFYRRPIKWSQWFPKEEMSESDRFIEDLAWITFRFTMAFVAAFLVAQNHTHINAITFHLKRVCCLPETVSLVFLLIAKRHSIDKLCTCSMHCDLCVVRCITLVRWCKM